MVEDADDDDDEEDDDDDDAAEVRVVEETGDDGVDEGDKSSPSFEARIDWYAAGSSDAGIRPAGIAGVTGCVGSETKASPETELLTDWPLRDLSLSYFSRAKLSAMLSWRSQARGYWGYLDM